MRPWVEKAYGIPPEQVIGSSVKTKFQIVDGKPELLRLPELNFIDDGPGKPEGINQHIGRRPIAAFGNSDGNQQMLKWTAAGGGPRLRLLVPPHRRGERVCLRPQLQLRQAGQSLDEANAKRWTVVSMKDDWKMIFPSQ